MKKRFIITDWLKKNSSKEIEMKARKSLKKLIYSSKRKETEKG
jgi:hypothetical protein